MRLKRASPLSLSQISEPSYSPSTSLITTHAQPAIPMTLLLSQTGTVSGSIHSCAFHPLHMCMSLFLVLHICLLPLFIGTSAACLHVSLSASLLPAHMPCHASVSWFHESEAGLNLIVSYISPHSLQSSGLIHIMCTLCTTTFSLPSLPSICFAGLLPPATLP